MALRKWNIYLYFRTSYKYDFHLHSKNTTSLYVCLEWNKFLVFEEVQKLFNSSIPIGMKIFGFDIDMIYTLVCFNIECDLSEPNHTE